MVASGPAGGHVHPDAADDVAAGLTARTELFEPADAALATGTASFHPAAYPNFLLREKFVSLGRDHRLLRKLLFFLRLVLREIARVRSQLAPVQLHNARGNTVQE